MLTHVQVWAAIEALAAQEGLSLSGLARKAKLDATCFNKSKRVSPNGKPRWPSTEVIAKVLQACGKDARHFAALATTKRLTIPVIGIGQAGKTGYWNLDHGYPTGQGWDELSLAGLIDDPHAYGIRVAGDSMEPVFRDKAIVVASPSASVQQGDRAVIRLVSGEVLIKEILKISTKQVTLHSCNLAYPDRIFPKSEISFMHRIVLVSQ